MPPWTIRYNGSCIVEFCNLFCFVFSQQVSPKVWTTSSKCSFEQRRIIANDCPSTIRHELSRRPKLTILEEYWRCVCHPVSGPMFQVPGGSSKDRKACCMWLSAVFQTLRFVHSRGTCPFISLYLFLFFFYFFENSSYKHQNHSCSHRIYNSVLPRGTLYMVIDLLDNLYEMKRSYAFLKNDLYWLYCKLCLYTFSVKVN